ncbi:MAG: hypothetical protein HZC10_00735 [Nitrospirae bacterium]|nr:hypothetical protein [Nitrospirota bacterium]
MDKKIWEIPNTIVDGASNKSTEASSTKKVTHPYLKTNEKNPAIAATLSMLLWGGGQIYNKDTRHGIPLLLAMIGSGLAFSMIIVNWDTVFTFLKGIGLTPMNIILMFFFMYALIMLLWYGNIIHAYLSVDRTRSEPFNGTDHPVLSGIASTLIPGWGQILNGQFKKGMLYLFSFFSGVFCLTFVISANVLWPSIDMEHERSTFETVLLATVIMVLITSLLWLINIFDAIIVAFEPVKKESVRKRLRYSINRLKSRKNQIEIWQRMKVTVFLILLLMLSVAISYSLFPKEYYRSRGNTTLKNTVYKSRVLK